MSGARRGPARAGAGEGALLGSRAVDALAIRDALIGLAAEIGVEVRVAGSGADGPAPQSGECRVRGSLWVVLSRADPLDVQIEVLARCLRAHPDVGLDSRYLPPAVRERLQLADF